MTQAMPPSKRTEPDGADEKGSKANGAPRAASRLVALDDGALEIVLGLPIAERERTFRVSGTVVRSLNGGALTPMELAEGMSRLVLFATGAHGGAVARRLAQAAATEGGMLLGVVIDEPGADPGAAYGVLRPISRAVLSVSGEDDIVPLLGCLAW